MLSLTNGASVRLQGALVDSPGAGQEKELKVSDVEVLGECDPEVCLPPFYAACCFLTFSHADVPNAKASIDRGVSARPLSSPRTNKSDRCHVTTTRHCNKSDTFILPGASLFIQTAHSLLTVPRIMASYIYTHP